MTKSRFQKYYAANKEKEKERKKNWYERQDKQALYQKRKEQRLARGETNYYSTPERCYKMYIRNASSRSLVFDLTLEEFKEFWQAACHYCNAEIKTVGLDRKEPTLGYTKENVVSCCRICNFMKGTLAYEDFIRQCQKITENLKGSVFRQ